jgi:prepilin-type N-terminal cleavage/methylation domain-containing protein
MGSGTATSRAARGFTLVELLIVVIILAILAAVVVPQFVATTDDAKDAALDTTLVNMRAAMDLYYQQHGEYPSAKDAGGTFGAADSNAAFINQLAKYTDDEGAVSNTKDATYKFGPYLRKDSLPSEPLTNSNALVIITTGTLGATADAGDPGGWKFDNVTGQFFVNDQNYDDR